MKILVLSVSAGGGHGHAAEAIKNYTLLNNCHSEIKIIDTLKYINPFINKVIIGGYLQSIKITPSLFGKLYDFSETDHSLASFSNKVNELLAHKLLSLIKEFEPDIIIATHPFPCEMLSILKVKNKIDLPAICILTDYAPHSFWIHPGIDAYVVSNSDMKEEMVTRGVDENRIYDLGIPVSPNFIFHYEKQETLRELKFSENKPTFLVMGGSLGMGNISNIYKQLSAVSKDIQIIIITGKNKKLYSELLKLKENSNKQTRIIGYTTEVNKYMQACDLLLTKPGGLTITEALISKTPLALFSPIPGQEKKNAEFLIRHNLAISLGDEKNCIDIIEYILSNPSILTEMKNNCSKFSKPTSGNDILNLIHSLIQKKEIAITSNKKSDGN